MKTLLKNFSGRMLKFAMAILLANSMNLKAQIGDVIWQENFNSLDTSIWNITIGDGCDIGLCGWGNAELEYYNKRNVYIADVPGETGNKALVLEAKNESMGTRAFTSGKVNTSGKVSLKYGLVEARVRIPNLQTGLWPAVWMLGTSTQSWPAKGEIDIMEMGHSLAERTRQGFPNSNVNNFVGSNLIFYSSSACSDANPTCAASTGWDVNYDSPYVPSTALNDRFVIYRMYWSSSSIRFTVIDNGTETDLYTSPFPISSESDEFLKPFYFIFNLAIGGNFTDATTNSQITASLPAKMYIDYIKVSKWNNEGEITFGVPAETGTFGVYTDNTAITNKLVAGTSSDIYAWSSNLTSGNIAPYEGSNVIAWATTTANAWFGGGVLARQPRNMTNYSNGYLKFKIKIPADVNFMAGFTEPKGNHWVAFPANTTAYGLTRNGNWAQATIPISAFGSVDLSQVAYMFAINTLDGASLPASTIQFAIDDITWEEGTPNQNCTATASTGDFTVTASNADTNPTLTFIPSRTGVGSSVCILYYGTSASGTFPGYYVTPNTPYQISATAGQTVYFYYTYSLPGGGENNTMTTKNSFTVGNCGTLKFNPQSISKNNISEDIELWPNPVNDKLFIKLNSSGTKQVQVLSTTGNIIHTMDIREEPFTQINMGNYKPGVYFIKCIGQSAIIKKVVRE